MRKTGILILAVFLACSVCSGSKAYAGLFPAQEEKKVKKEANIKEAREVDLPALRNRAKFLKQKIEELKSQGQEKIKVTDTLINGAVQVLESMNKIDSDTGLPTKINAWGYHETDYPPIVGRNSLEISQVILKLEEAITIIDSIIGPEKTQ